MQFYLFGDLTTSRRHLLLLARPTYQTPGSRQDVLVVCLRLCLARKAMSDPLHIADLHLRQYYSTTLGNHMGIPKGLTTMPPQYHPQTALAHSRTGLPTLLPRIPGTTSPCHWRHGEVKNMLTLCGTPEAAQFDATVRRTRHFIRVCGRNAIFISSVSPPLRSVISVSFPSLPLKTWSSLCKQSRNLPLRQP